MSKHNESKNPFDVQATKLGNRDWVLEIGGTPTDLDPFAGRGILRIKPSELPALIAKLQDATAVYQQVEGIPA